MSTLVAKGSKPLQFTLAVSLFAPVVALRIVISFNTINWWYQFPGVTIPRYFSPASDSHFLHIVFRHRPTIFLLGFPTDVFPSGIFVNTFSTFLSSGIISSCHNHHNIRNKTGIELLQRQYQSISVPYKLQLNAVNPLKTMYLFF